VTEVRVTPEQLESVGSQLHAGSQEVERQLASMKSQVENLVNAEWQGAASASFYELFQKWQRGAADVKEGLEGISRMVGQAARAYRETEQQLANQMRGGS
jgi:WXG100 family type VII secretion target